MKAKKKLGCMFILLLISIASNAQHGDTLFCKAKVVKMDTIKYYVVIRAVANEKHITILSVRDEINTLIEKSKDSCTIKVDNEYDFVLYKTVRIKNGKGSYYVIPLRDLYYDKIHLLKAGEVPYLAINMYGFKIYN